MRTLTDTFKALSGSLINLGIAGLLYWAMLILYIQIIEKSKEINTSVL